MKKSRITFKRVEQKWHADLWSIRYAGREIGRTAQRGANFYWYALDCGPCRNTINEPESAISFEGCKAEAIAHFKPLVENL